VRKALQERWGKTSALEGFHFYSAPWDEYTDDGNDDSDEENESYEDYENDEYGESDEGGSDGSDGDAHWEDATDDELTHMPAV